MLKVGFIGFGEAGTAFARGLNSQRPTLDLAGFDIQVEHSDTKLVRAKEREFAINNVNCFSSAHEVATYSQLIFSLVTPDQALQSARSVAGTLQTGALYLDGNSCSPKTKKRCEEVILAAGGRYVDMGVMAPVLPKLHKTPVLLSGGHAEDAARHLAELGMNCTVQPGGVGQASAVKMIRSVMVKGMEALIAECLLSAREAGVEKMVLESLEQSFPRLNWPERAAYNLERMMVHGVRRAAEMREVAATVADLGLGNDMSCAIAAWQQRIGGLTLGAGPGDSSARLDMILAALDMTQQDTEQQSEGLEDE